MKKKILSHLLCIALVILCSALMPIMLFFANVGAVKFYEIAVFIGIYSFIGLAVFTVLRFILKSEYKAGIAAGFFSLIFQNAGRLAKLMPYKFVLLIFVLVVAALIFAIWKFLKDEIARVFVPVLSAVLTMLLIMNTVLSLGKITSVANVDSEIQADIDKQYTYLSTYKDETKSPDELPNIYIIIPDEYAGFNSLEKFYDYDNAEFENFLSDYKFNVSKSSTNYLSHTYACLANFFNLEFSEKNNYLNTNETYCKQKVENACLFQLAEYIGYNINVAQSLPLTEYESQTKSYSDNWSITADGKSTIDLLTSPSMLAPFVDRLRAVLNGKPMNYFSGGAAEVYQREAYTAPLEYFAKSENVGKKSSLNLCYVNLPHVPFLFDQDGTPIKAAGNKGNWADKSYYLNQLKYCTTLIENAVDNIIANDPNSIIVIMSDHGVRDHSEEDLSASWMSQMTPKDEADILCAVYYKGEEFIDIEGMCGSNVLISIINDAWGYNIPLIEQSDDMYYKAP